MIPSVFSWKVGAASTFLPIPGGAGRPIDGCLVRWSVRRLSGPAGASSAVLRYSDSGVFEYNQHVESVSPDGKALIYTERHPVTGEDLWVLPLDGDRKPWPFLDSDFNEARGHVSPDGRWLAYQSDEAGQPEVYLQPFPDPGRELRVSLDGGEFPVWGRDGQELFYRHGAEMMSVAVITHPDVILGEPEHLFEGAYLPVYDVARDERLVMIEAPPSPAAQINAVLNWFDELKRLVPTDN